MLTIFHLLPLVGAFAGLMAGTAGGASLGGAPGAIFGAALGGILGYIAGQFPFILALHLLSRRIGAKTTSELRTELQYSNCLIPNIIILELTKREEDVSQELLVVINMLVSEDYDRRAKGLAALISVFPKLASTISSYRIDDPVELCRKKTSHLFAKVESNAASNPCIEVDADK